MFITAGRVFAQGRRLTAKNTVSADQGFSKVQDKIRRSINESNMGTNALCYNMHKMKYSFYYLLLSHFGGLKKDIYPKALPSNIAICISFCHLWKSLSHHLATLWILSWSPLCQTCGKNVKKMRQNKSKNTRQVEKLWLNLPHWRLCCVVGLSFLKTGKKSISIMVKL